MLVQKSLAACAIAAVVSLGVILIACGGSSNHNLSQAQAQAVSTQLFSAVGDAMAAGFYGTQSGDAAARARLSALVRQARPAQLSTDCTVTDSGENCNVPISFTGPCPGGGSISVAGDFIFTLDSSGSGSDTSTLTVTPTNCSVDGETYSGDPSVTVGTQFALTDNVLDYPITFTEKGGISFAPSPTGSCTMNVSVSVTATGCTATGTVCGRSVTGNCQ